MHRKLLAFLLGFAPLFAGEAWADDDLALGLVEVVREAAERGDVLGAQIAITDRAKFVGSWSFGKLGPDRAAAVDDETLFCIGSCSKPLASACVLSLVDAGKLDLDRPIDEYLAGFKEPRFVNGEKAPRAPTVRELLSHRGGLYSQKFEITPEQTRAIRDFSLSLEESTKIIAQQPLIAPPGDRFAYSGAGYCIVGRVAEAAGKRSFEQILQQRICRPLKMNRTTYFPDRNDANVAAGAVRRNGELIAHPQTPHLQGEKLRLPLIGGSIYSTAAETSSFARAMLNKGRAKRRRIFSKSAWRETTRSQFPQQPYGLGWLLKIENDRVVAMSHNGSLAGNRSLLHVDLKRGRAVVVHWTLSDVGNGNAATGVQRRLREVVDNGQW